MDLRVFQYSSICNQTYSPSQLYKFLSFPGAFRIRRQPTVAITTAPFSVNCGDRTPRTLTATASQSQGLTGFVWNLPSGWTFQGPSNTASVQVIPKGDNGGNITVEANYSCGPSTPTLPSAPLTVGYTQSVAPVYISLGSSNSLYCGTGSVTMSAFTSGTPGTYQWTASNGATVSPTTTNDASTPVRVSGGLDGDITVTVKASNPAFGCAPSSSSITVYHNRGVIPEAMNPLQLTVTGSNGSFVAPNGSTTCGRIVQFQVNGLDLYHNPLPGTLRWIVDGQEYSAGTSLAVPLRQSQVTIVLKNTCNLDDYYYWTVPVEGTCSGGGSGGTGPLDPEPYNPGLVAYPNPANGDITVGQRGGAVRLYNAYGQPVRSQMARPGKLHLDTSGLPAGLYFLELPTAQGKTTRQQIRIEH